MALYKMSKVMTWQKNVIQLQIMWNGNFIYFSKNVEKNEYFLIAFLPQTTLFSWYCECIIWSVASLSKNVAEIGLNRLSVPASGE